MRFFGKFPEVIAAMSESADGQMGSSTNSGADGTFGRNRRQFLQKLGVDPARTVMGGLIHGTAVGLLDGLDAKNPAKLEPCDPDGLRAPNTDALISAGTPVAVTTSDCYPCFFYAPARQLVGIAHAGWRGIVEGIIPEMVRRFTALGVSPEDLWVRTGPGIQPCCFIVGDDKNGVRNYHEYADEDVISKDAAGHWHVDLPRILEVQFRSLGLHRDRIAITPDCTACNANAGRFYSHRRDKTDAGGGINMLSVIGLR